MKDIAAIILAAGRSKRMFTNIPKVLHEVGNKPLIDRVLEAVSFLKPKSVHTVVGYEKEQIMEHLGEKVNFVEQKELLGTGHAVQQVVPFLGAEQDVLVICGDMPLISGAELEAFYRSHKDSGKAFSLMSAVVPWESDFGRIIRDQSGNVSAIREYKDASGEERKVKEVNLALYLINREALLNFLPLLKSENVQKEFYLTDLVSLMAAKSLQINAYICEDPIISRGVNSRVDLAELNAIVKNRKLHHLMMAGVTVIDPASCFVDEDVEIGMDTVLHPFTVITGKTVIGKNCSIGPSATVKDASIADGVTILNSIILSSEIGENASVGPFSYVRPDNKVGRNVRIGDFVEIKKSVIGDGSKVPHLSYVGDAIIGEKVNIGAGTITCNYDGKNKHRTEIGDGTHIGSNTNLVAPVSVGKNVVTGAGSVVTRDLPDGAVAFGVPAKIKK